MRDDLRSPRLQVLADGAVLGGVVSVEVSSNNHLAADRFRVQLAAGAGELGRIDAPDVRFDVQVGIGGAWTSLVVGEADCVSLDPLRGTIDVEGRDLSALMVDTRVDETFANETASEIAGKIAARHGLQSAATTTTTLVGRYYQSDHDRLTMGTSTRAMSEWDLLAYLAGREGFDLFVEGEVLRFEAREVGDAVVVTPSDCLSLRMDHAMGMSRSIEVMVQSWDQRGAQAVLQTARSGGSGRAWKHSVVRPNLPADDAQRLAERILADLVRHERTVSLSMPGELTMTPRASVRLEGTSSGWDGTYSVSEVSRHLDVRHGFVQSVSLQDVR